MRLNSVSPLTIETQTALLDLLLIHQPAGKYAAGYRQMEKAYKAGKVHAIGLSNFNKAQIEELLSLCEVNPTVLQTELHPYHQKPEMKAFLKENGIRTERLISHVMLYQPAGYRLMAVTDGGMNPFPDLAKKTEILENAAITMKSIGFGKLYAACICGAETVNPKIQSMVDAQELAGISERWSKYDMQVYGPVGLDLAVSREACAHKKYNAPGAGMADILLVPNYEVGNAMGKAMSLFGGAKSAGIIVGAKVPIVLVSRSDNAETKLASIAFGAVAARG